MQDIINNLKSGITVRGELVAECIMYYDKNIENRKQKIKNHKYLALHLGSGNINKEVKKHLLENLKDVEYKKHNLPKGHIVAVLKMGDSKKVDELTEEESKSKWVYQGDGYDVCNYIEEVYILKNPIKCRGFQSLTWNLECVDNNLKKKEKFEKKLKEKIIEELPDFKDKDMEGLQNLFNEMELKEYCNYCEKELCEDNIMECEECNECFCDDCIRNCDECDEIYCCNRCLIDYKENYYCEICYEKI